MNLHIDKPPEERHGDILVLLSDVNESFLHLLVDGTTSPVIAVSESVTRLQELLRSRPDAVVQAALAPVLLLNVEFQNQDWWTAVAREPSSRFGDRIALFPREKTVELTRTALMLAWHFARADRATCLALLGLSPSVIPIVAALRPKQVEQIAEHQHPSLRPRWEDHPSVWQQLLARTAGDQLSMRALTIRALELSWVRPRPSI